MNELYHHGVKGQKWGVRRYQNADGTLTEVGYYSDPEVKDEKRTNELIKLYVKQTSELKKIMRDCADIVLKDAKVKNQKEIDRFMSDMAGMLDDELD